MRYAALVFGVCFAIGITILISLAVANHFFGDDWAGGLFMVWLFSLFTAGVVRAAHDDTDYSDN
jgi:hypothetical protein